MPGSMLLIFEEVKNIPAAKKILHEQKPGKKYQRS